jgi:MFS superfamily sulfate permease-like transporter
MKSRLDSCPGGWPTARNGERMASLDTARSPLAPSRANLLKHDGPAGLVVYLVALPLCLGVALASGAPLFAGILAGIVGGCLISVLSAAPRQGSR